VARGRRVIETEQGAREEASIVIDTGDERVLRRLSGPGHQNLRLIADELHIQVGARGEQLHLAGEAVGVRLAGRLFRDLLPVVKKVRALSPSDVVQALRIMQDDDKADLQDIFLDVVVETRSGRAVTPKGLGQKRYVEAIRKNDITFSVGPAGTGKTYLAMALAVRALDAQQVARIVLTRPAVEAGEHLGFLPGDLEAKVNPYLRPLYDALFELLGVEQAQALMDQRVVEVAPLAFMRGRTLNDAFVILDEAQNTTREQMRMFLTRLGFGSKMVVTGDATQVDLPQGRRSGLADAVRVLDGVEGVEVCRLTDRDVVRHPMVGRVVRAYELDESRRAAPAPPDSGLESAP
jgi:phosphate starvation-inducible protein PhoH and related proteins